MFSKPLTNEQKKIWINIQKQFDFDFMIQHCMHKNKPAEISVYSNFNGSKYAINSKSDNPKFNELDKLFDATVPPKTEYQKLKQQKPKKQEVETETETKSYYEINKVRILERKKRKYDEEHTPKEKTFDKAEYDRQYKIDNREKINARRRKKYQENKEKKAKKDN